MEEKTEAVKGEETTVGLTMNYNPFSFISCQEDALVLAGCISHGLDADVIKKSGDLSATARAMLLDACVCLLYRQGGDSMSMQGLVDLLQNDISHNEDQDMPSIKAAYDKIEADGATVEEDLGLKRYRMFQAIAYGETAISVPAAHGYRQQGTDRASPAYEPEDARSSGIRCRPRRRSRHLEMQ